MWPVFLEQRGTRDTDSDGYGDSSTSQVACSAPSGYVSNSTDLCDDNTACNYDANSVTNAACQYNDACGVCGGSGIPAGDCDCNGNQNDAIGVCGGTCTTDSDSDGVCDDAGNDLVHGPNSLQLRRQHYKRCVCVRDGRGTPTLTATGLGTRATASPPARSLRVTFQTAQTFATTTRLATTTAAVQTLRVRSRRRGTPTLTATGLGTRATASPPARSLRVYVSNSTDLCDDNTACNYDGSTTNAACAFATTWYAGR